ncbi:transposase [Streptomyces sp. R39]|uniref:Transposase n=1 Tax=Streptomyces sp. R39 TaxID=3238631 RepID=A0AB39R128_9ACTN
MLPQLYALAPTEFNWTAPTCDCAAHRFGNAADHRESVRRYPSDMTDAEWAVVRPLLPVPGWMRGRGGQPEAYCHRAILDAIRYLVDNGIKWRAMLQPGEPAFVDNRLSVHGRTTFEARYDGRDRWLHRTFVHLDNRRNRRHRGEDGFVLD